MSWIYECKVHGEVTERGPPYYGLKCPECGRFTKCLFFEDEETEPLEPV